MRPIPKTTRQAIINMAKQWDRDTVDSIFGKRVVKQVLKDEREVVDAWRTHTTQ